MSQKMCRECLQIKPLDEYYKHPLAPDGRDYTCQDCKRAYMRAMYPKNNQHRIPRKFKSAS